VNAYREHAARREQRDQCLAMVDAEVQQRQEHVAEHPLAIEVAKRREEARLSDQQWSACLSAVRRGAAELDAQRRARRCAPPHQPLPAAVNLQGGALPASTHPQQQVRSAVVSAEEPLLPKPPQEGCSSTHAGPCSLACSVIVAMRDIVS